MSETSANCATILANISAYLDGELETTACAEIEAHCATCASCEALVQSLRATVGLCREAAAAPLPEDVRHRARESVRRLLENEARKD
jgi:anti-sigma factor RsiW